MSDGVGRLRRERPQAEVMKEGPQLMIREKQIKSSTFKNGIL